jgi:hypothetical protein
VNVQRIVVGVGLLLLIAPAARIRALAALVMLALVLVGLVAFEATRFSELRERVRHEDGVGAPPATDRSSEV